MPLNTAFLSKLSYRDGKGKIAALFESNNDLVECLFEFVPEIRLPLNNAVSALVREIVSPHASSELFFSEGEGALSIRSRSFSSLRKAHALLSISLRARIPLIEPERQFLLQRNWSYFDEFSVRKHNIEKKNSLGLSLKSIDFHSGIPLKKIFFSNLLSVKPESLPLRELEMGQILLENAAFKSSCLVPLEKNSLKRTHFNGKAFNDFIELDFSRAVLEKIVESNLGFESLNCDCCKPQSISSDNVLSNSLVGVEFKENGYYFESLFQSFSQQFHESNPNRKARIDRKREFYLENYPVGPFYSGQRALVPLADAIKLEQDNIVSITSEKNELKWCCRKRKSFLASEISRLLSLERVLKEKIELLEKKELRENGLNAFNPSFTHSEKNALIGFAEVCSELTSSIFSSLLWSKSSFYQKTIFEAIEGFKSQMLSNYNKVLEQRHFEPIYSSAGRAFIRNREIFTDLAMVSREIGIPLPSLY